MSIDVLKQFADLCHMPQPSHHASMMAQLSTPSASHSQQPPPYGTQLAIRKNACLLCNICFTCKKYYGVNCECSDIQPRRGKNLPINYLDSRAKKLNPSDPDDYAFSMEWLQQNAHPAYKDQNGLVPGLNGLKEVSLCKAHSSSLYRAKKKHDSIHHPEGGPSPMATTSTEYYSSMKPERSTSTSFSSRVSQVGPSDYGQRPSPYIIPSPTLSATLKRQNRKRPMGNLASMVPQPSPSPYQSSSTPIGAQGPNSPPLMGSFHQGSHSHPPFGSPPQPMPSMSTRSLMHQQFSPPSPDMPLPEHSYPIVKTVTLKPAPSLSYALPSTLVHNLAIADNFTFRNLLECIDQIGSPPPGKKVVIMDAEGHVEFPLDVEIRKAVQAGGATHVDLSLGLLDAPTVDWSRVGQ